MSARRMPNGQTVEANALAYRVWCAAQAVGWNVTMQDLADVLDEPVARIRRICQLRGWTHRLLSTAPADQGAAGVAGFDDDLIAIGAEA